MKTRAKIKAFDPALVDLWQAEGDAIRIGTDGWLLSAETELFEIAPDGRVSHFPDSNPVSIFRRIYGTGAELVGV